MSLCFMKQTPEPRAGMWNTNIVGDSVDQCNQWICAVIHILHCSPYSRTTFFFCLLGTEVGKLQRKQAHVCLEKDNVSAVYLTFGRYVTSHASSLFQEGCRCMGWGKC